MFLQFLKNSFSFHTCLLNVLLVFSRNTVISFFISQVWWHPKNIPHIHLGCSESDILLIRNDMCVLCMYVCAYVSICIYMYMCSVYMCTCICMCYVCVYVCMYECVYLCTCVYVCLYVYVCVCHLCHGMHVKGRELLVWVTMWVSRIKPGSHAWWQALYHWAIFPVLALFYSKFHVVGSSWLVTVS